jgi:hypothetical protein
MDQWYYAKKGEPAGPFSLDDIRFWVKMGEVQPETKVWKTGLDEWVEARSREELFPTGAATSAAATPPPLETDDIWLAIATQKSDLERRLEVRLGRWRHKLVYAMSPTMTSEKVQVDDRTVYDKTCRLWQAGTIDFTIDDAGALRRFVVEKHVDTRTFHRIERFRLTVDGRELYTEGA